MYPGTPAGRHRGERETDRKQNALIPSQKQKHHENNHYSISSDPVHAADRMRRHRPEHPAGGGRGRRSGRPRGRHHRQQQRQPERRRRRPRRRPGRVPSPAARSATRPTTRTAQCTDSPWRPSRRTRPPPGRQTSFRPSPPRPQSGFPDTGTGMVTNTTGSPDIWAVPPVGFHVYVEGRVGLPTRRVLLPPALLAVRPRPIQRRPAGGPPFLA